ncbi:SOUL family heme-binding protein [Roseococcus sp. DSY-14]|uniref:SOUL family heme-binding protein n=1 Tax=Roseococcus sp. DSY-14 TaxID=3369650 RepID=UPI00387B2E16
MRRGLLLLPLLAACSAVGVRSGTEEPAFTVLDGVGGVEVRQLGPRLLAEVEVEAEDEVAARNAGFRPLAAYIFGRNQAAERIGMTAPVTQAGGERIGMTAPVSQSREGGRWRIGFVMPARYSLATLPRPLDPAILVREARAETVAVLRFAGAPSPERVADAQARLAASLAASAWEATGPGGAWFHDPPWTIPALRRNEAWLPVRRRQALPA